MVNYFRLQFVKMKDKYFIPNIKFSINTLQSGCGHFNGQGNLKCENQENCFYFATNSGVGK